MRAQMASVAAGRTSCLSSTKNQRSRRVRQDGSGAIGPGFQDLLTNDLQAEAQLVRFGTVIGSLIWYH